MNQPSSSHARLLTEQRHPGSAALDRMSAGDAFDLMNREDALAVAAVARARDDIVRAVELISARLHRAGRLFYIGAGTSGRLGALDAAECPPTFQSDPGQIQAIIAGGARALTEAVEGAEDDEAAARTALKERNIGEMDAVLGIAASGTTPFVRAAIRYAKEVGAASILLACVPFEQAPDEADVSIRVLAGPEVLTGSTRLKAGTATKLVLNMISTLSMVRLGKVYENLMVDVNARGNRKLFERASRIVRELTGMPYGDAADLLERADGQVKVAVVMHRFGVNVSEAARRLDAAGGFLRNALGS